MDYLYYNIDDKLGAKKVLKLSKGSSRNFLICKEEIANNIEPIFENLSN